MKRKLLIGFVVVAIALLSISFVAAMPFGRGPELSEEERAEMEAHREAVDAAIESNDYATWKTLMEEQIEKMKAGLTEERFEEVGERHTKMSEVRELRDELREAHENEDFDRVEEIRAELDALRPVEGEHMQKERCQGPRQGMSQGLKQGFRNRF